MPEGHLIHWYARQQRDGLGRTVTAASPQGKFADEAARLRGRELESVEAYGKHLFHGFGDVLVHVHLGMQGLFLHHTQPAPAPRRQVRLRLDGERLAVDLIAPRTCALVTPDERDALVATLGPDPLREPAAHASVWERMRDRDASVGALLLDQTLVAGIGNALRAEVLFAARIHPARAASSLTEEEFGRLWEALVAVMRHAADEGRIATVRRADGSIPDDEAEARYVYKQEHCRSCGGPVRAWELGGRTAYACQREQPPPDAVRVGGRRQ